MVYVKAGLNNFIFILVLDFEIACFQQLNEMENSNMSFWEPKDFVSIPGYFGMWKLLAWIHYNHVDTLHFNNLPQHGKPYSKDWVSLVIVFAIAGVTRCRRLHASGSWRTRNIKTIKQHKQEASRIWQQTLIYECCFTHQTSIKFPRISQKGCC